MNKVDYDGILMKLYLISFIANMIRGRFSFS